MLCNIPQEWISHSCCCFCCCCHYYCCCCCCCCYYYYYYYYILACCISKIFNVHSVHSQWSPYIKECLLYTVWISRRITVDPIPRYGNFPSTCIQFSKGAPSVGSNLTQTWVTYVWSYAQVTDDFCTVYNNGNTTTSLIKNNKFGIVNRWRQLKGSTGTSNYNFRLH